MLPTPVWWALSASWRSATTCRRATASPPPTPPNCRSRKTENLGTAATAKKDPASAPSESWPPERVQLFSAWMSTCIRGCMSVWKTARLQACACVSLFYKPDVSFFSFVSFCWRQCRSEGATLLRGQPEKAELQRWWTDHQTAFIYEGDGQRRWGGACVYIELEAVCQWTHVVCWDNSRRCQSLGRTTIYPNTVTTARHGHPRNPPLSFFFSSFLMTRWIHFKTNSTYWGLSL